MTLMIMAILATSLAAISGFVAIGNGQHWHFSLKDIFQGKRNAILYLWVVFSTIFSMCHSGFLVEFSLRNQWQIACSDQAGWMIVHICNGLLLTCAHLFVAVTLAKEVGPVDKHLWGPKSRAVS